jgi:DNA-directed RNA polymerase subunit beta'
MPRDADGNPLEIIVNPSGVPGRINVGQVYETVLGNVAKKTGVEYAISNFEPDDSKKIVKVKGHFRNVKTKAGPKRIWIEGYEYERGYHEMVQQEVDQSGVSETTELFDPETGKSLGDVLVGQQYIIKHSHQIDKKISTRAFGAGLEYDVNRAPKGGGKHGAQRFGELGLYVMLAHGATANIRDALTYKSDMEQNDVWTAVQTGNLLPPPQVPFAYKKFVGYLNALGVNVEKEGNDLILTPLTDAQILEKSAGALLNAKRLFRGKDLKPEKGGLFDEEITGGPSGDKWSHIVLAEPLPNPLFEKAIVSLLGITRKSYRSVLSGESGFNEKGEVVPASEATSFGGQAIKDRLSLIDVKKELKDTLAKLPAARRADLDKLNKKAKFLAALKNNEMSPEEAYILENLPVLPPMFRPVTVMERGDLNIQGPNLLYKDVAILNEKLDSASMILPDEELVDLRSDLYQAVSSLMGTGTPGSGGSDLTVDGQPKPPGILSTIAGPSPKRGYFHEYLLKRKQDLTMRSVIVPDMNLHLDELGLPRKGAMDLYKPFVVQEMVRMGKTPLQARDEIDKNTKLANTALDVAVSKRPVLFKRDPALHKYGVMAFKPKLHDESSIHIHPLVVVGFNADFDGDIMSVYTPVSQDAVDEAYKMLPSKNMFNPTTGRVMYQPTLEGQLGLFLMTQWGKESGKTYKTHDDALAAAEAGDISMTDVITAGGTKTTAGRLAFYSVLPKSVREPGMLTDKEQFMGKKQLQATLRQLAVKAPDKFGDTVDKIKDLGFGHAYNTGFSFSLDDFKPMLAVKAKHLNKAAKEAERIVADKRLSKFDKDRKIVDLYTKVGKDINKDAKAVLEKESNKLFAMHKAGVKPGWLQLQQMLLAPVLLTGLDGNPIPAPVTRSYGEGLDTAGYWIASTGARKTMLDKSNSVRDPGYLSKQLMNTTIPYVVSKDDCQTPNGISLPITDRDAVDRYLAKPLKAGGVEYAAGSVVTPNMLSKLKAAKVSKVVVRSTLKCEAPKGLCSKCYGLNSDGKRPSVGTNIGILAGQSIGERAVQISMKTFHTGGVAGAGAPVSAMDRLNALLKFPKKVPNAATLATVSGEVSKIDKDPAGGYNVHIGSKVMYAPSGRQLLVGKGDKVKKGQQLTTGLVDPRELLSHTNMDRVQRYLSDELHDVYSSEGVKRRNMEVVTKALTNLGVVEDPGDSDEFLPGDYASLSYVASKNKELGKKIVVTPTLRGITTLPLDQTTDWLARLQYKGIKETLRRGVSERWVSDLHGLHPIPGIAYGAEFGKGKKGPY